jgi:hypothetical protein
MVNEASRMLSSLTLIVTGLIERVLGARPFDHESGLSLGNAAIPTTRDVLIKHEQSGSALHVKRRPLLFSMIYCFLGTVVPQPGLSSPPPSA